MIKRISQTICLLVIILIQSITSFAQSGMNFQGVARNSSGVILATQPIAIRLSILQGTISGIIEYQETKTITTNAQGLFNLVIGDGTATSAIGNYNNINWQLSPKFVKIEMDASAGNNFITLGTTQLQYVAYAYFANGVAAENIVGLVPVARGGTGSSNLLDLKNNLQLNKVNNTEDSLKPISKAVTFALLNKLNNADTIHLSNRINTKLNITDTIGMANWINSKMNSADTLSLSNRINLKLNLADGLGALVLKANTSDVNTNLSLKANVSDVNASLALKANSSDLISGLSGKVDKVTGKELSTNDYSNAEKTKLAAISGTNTGDQDLSSYATNTALAFKANTSDVNTSLALKANASDVTTSLALKENAANKSSAADLGGVSPSDVLFPTQKAVKDYVTANNSSGSVADGGITTIKLADLAVTDAKLASGINKSKVGLSNVENTALSTWSGTNNLTTLGIISSGTWSGTAISIENGGTGATTAAAARTNLGLKIGTNVQAPLVAGTDYQIPLTAGASYIVPNSAITASTKTKITYDTKGLITAGGDATTADIAPSTDRNYVTDVKADVLSNTSGTNTGDETTSSIKSKLGILTLSGSNTGDQTNITGNAATATTATTAGNITATTNTTLTSLSNLATVGTITSGVWSGTAVAVEKGGTGATSAAAARSNLGLVIGTNVQAPLVAGTDYQIPLTAGTSYIVPNGAITGATKTKITFDTKGLVTAGADATTADIAPSSNRNYVTDVQAGVISNTSGINTGDENTSSIKSKLGITTLSGANTGDQVLPTLVSLGAVPNSRTITINGTSLDLSSDRSFTINGGLSLTDITSSNIKAKTFELTQPSTINSTSTTTLDLSSGNIFELVLSTTNTTLAFSNPKIGTYIIKVKQDVTGGGTLTFPSMKWSDAAVPTITSTANAIDLITLIYDGTDYYGSCLQNF